MQPDRNTAYRWLFMNQPAQFGEAASAWPSYGTCPLQSRPKSDNAVRSPSHSLGAYRKIRAFHGGHYEECRLLGCYTVWLLWVFLRRVLRLLVTANAVPSSPTLVTMMMVEIRSSETSVFARAKGVTSQKTALFLTYRFKFIVRKHLTTVRCTARATEAFVAQTVFHEAYMSWTETLQKALYQTVTAERYWTLFYVRMYKFYTICQMYFYRLQIKLDCKTNLDSTLSCGH
jgi:hypothetical protein